MKIKQFSFFIFITLLWQTPISASIHLDNAQHPDSLLSKSHNQVYKNPEKSISQGLSIFENESNSIKTRTRALMLVSLGYTSKRDYQKSLEYIIKAGELSTHLDDKRLKIEILFSTGVLYQQLKIFDKSIEFMERTERLSLTYPDRNAVRSILANSYIVKGFIYKDNLNCDIALEFFNKGIREYEKLKEGRSNANLSIVYYNKGNCYTMLSEYGNAKNSFSRSIAFAKLQNANSLISFAEKGLAEVYTLEGEYEKAIILLEKALNQSVEVGDLILNFGIYKGLFENHLALNQSKVYQYFYDLYLKTQLEIKISERNSIDHSIDENYKTQNRNLVSIKTQFKRKVKWIILSIFIIILSVLFLEIKNKKIIRALKKRVETIQSIDQNLKTKQ